MLLALSACSAAQRHGTNALQSDAGDAGDAAVVLPGDNPESIVQPDAGPAPDAAVSVDTFFINDPAPPYCGPGNTMLSAAPIGGTPDCPDDKRRQGCPCDQPGQTAPCWPGKRVNRHHGICMDGVTTCQQNAEFGTVWSECKGYVLPKEGAVQGPDACRCFSNGQWALNNLVPCVYQDAQNVYLYSSRPDAAMGFTCDPVSMSPPAKPAADWNQSTLNVDCSGQFKLCYTMKAGLIAKPSADDCVLMQECVDIWYEQAGTDLTLPNLPGWVATDTACARRFVELGGYGEMSVFGKSSECDAVDDGHGQPYVFKRTSYCLPSCPSTPNRPECQGCATGGSGNF